MKTFYVKTLGCKVNQYDSQVIREQLLNRGFQEVGFNDNPDVCIVNTCSVTSRAQAKGRGYVNRLRRQYPGAVLVVTGCTVDYQPEAIAGKADFLVSNREKGSLVSNFVPLRRHAGAGTSDGDNGGITCFRGHTRAFVKVQDGCNEFCSYCILPYVRGRSRSRGHDSVVGEVKELVNNGYGEVVLAGVHLGDYGKDRGETDALVGLLKELEKVPRLIRIRLSSLEPQDVTGQLIEKVAESEKVCRHFHIPLQSGDDTILKRMNRRYVYGEYRDLLNTIACKIPGVTFTTDIMVGFPGETEEQFLASCRAVEEAGFVKVHIFPFSPRERTAAAGFPSRVPVREAKGRAEILRKVAGNTALRVKERFVGSLQEVLVEKSGRISRGYTSGYIPAAVRGSATPDILVKVRITNVQGGILQGKKFQKKLQFSP